MTRHRFISVRARLPVLAGALLLALAAPAAAQSEACVHLQVGSSFTATIQAIAGDGTTSGPSGAFAPGQTQCLKLDAIGAGVAFTVSVRAISGGGAACNPSGIPRAANLPAAVTFNASGTTQDVHCVAPTAATADSDGLCTCTCFCTDGLMPSFTDTSFGACAQDCLEQCSNGQFNSIQCTPISSGP